MSHKRGIEETWDPAWAAAAGRRCRGQMKAAGNSEFQTAAKDLSIRRVRSLSSMLFVFSLSCYNHLKGWQQKQRAKHEDIALELT